MGYVYLIHDKSNNVYKIGVTRYKNSNRLKQLQTGNSTELNIIYMYKTNYPFKLESMLHQYYKDSRLKGEWFKLNDLNEYINKCKSLDNIIDSLKYNPFFAKQLN